MIASQPGAKRRQSIATAVRPWIGVEEIARPKADTLAMMPVLRTSDFIRVIHDLTVVAI